MKRLSLFNHDKRLRRLERFESWLIVVLVWLVATVIGLGYVIKTGGFP